MFSAFLLCPVRPLRQRFAAPAPLDKALKAQSRPRSTRRQRKLPQQHSSALAATPFRRAPPASSFRNIFHRASVFVPVVHSTASSSLLCLAAILKSRRRGLVCQ